MGIELAVCGGIIEAQRGGQKRGKGIIDRRLAAVLGIQSFAPVKDLQRQFAAFAQMPHIAKMPEFVVRLENRGGGQVSDAKDEIKEQHPLERAERDVDGVDPQPKAQQLLAEAAGHRQQPLQHPV